MLVFEELALRALDDAGIEAHVVELDARRVRDRSGQAEHVVARDDGALRPPQRAGGDGYYRSESALDSAVSPMVDEE